MNPKYRFLYLLLGFSGLAYLIYYVVISFPYDINPAIVLAITIPDALFFAFAYKTYPAESDLNQ